MVGLPSFGSGYRFLFVFLFVIFFNYGIWIAAVIVVEMGTAFCTFPIIFPSSITELVF